MSKCSDDNCENQCISDAAAKYSAKGQLPGPTIVAITSLDMCGGYNECFNYGLSEPRMKVTEEPCCNKKCEAPLEKYFSTDAPHGFCGEACMDPAKFDTYHRFEANLTRATDDHPCSQQWTPSNTKQFTDYYQTVTHGFPGVLTVTLDLYAPTGMPDHSCCSTPLFKSLNCVGIPGKPQSMTIFGTGPYCCPASATEETPCGKAAEPTLTSHSDEIKVSEEPSATEPCCNKECEAPLEKYFSTDAPHGFCGEACMDPAKFDTYHKFEANLTRATSEHPCSEQLTPSNTKHFTDYYQTVTHGFPGVLTVTLDLYAPTGMPDHSCCSTPLFTSLNCFGIPGKPQSMTISGTGPYCCPASATETSPCGKAVTDVIV
jgi:hypothetical protein